MSREPETGRRGFARRNFLVGVAWVLISLSLLCAILAIWWWIGTRENNRRMVEPLVEATESVRQAFELDSAMPVDEDDPDVIYRKENETKKQIALTFDDGPHPKYTPIILDILEEYDVPATFFMVGENVKYYHDVAESVAAAGHEIGNHTYSHARLDRMSEEEIVEQICACEDEIASLHEYRPKFFRPPEGQLSSLVRQVSKEWDYRLVLWDVDTRDWAHTDPAVICRKVLDTVKPGDIILMHDFIGHNSPTPAALRLFIPALLEKGYEFVTVGELIDGD